MDNESDVVSMLLDPDTLAVYYENDITYEKLIESLFDGGVRVITNEDTSGMKDMASIGEWILVRSYFDLVNEKKILPNTQVDRLIKYTRMSGGGVASNDNNNEGAIITVVPEDDDTSSENVPRSSDDDNENREEMLSNYVKNNQLIHRPPFHKLDERKVVNVKSVIRRAYYMHNSMNEKSGKWFLKYLIYNTFDAFYGIKEEQWENSINKKMNSWIKSMKDYGYREYIESATPGVGINESLMKGLISFVGHRFYEQSDQSSIYQNLIKEVYSIPNKTWYSVNYVNKSHEIENMLLEYSNLIVTDMDTRVFCYVIGKFIRKRMIPVPRSKIDILTRLPFNMDEVLGDSAVGGGAIHKLSFRPSMDDAVKIFELLYSIFDLDLEIDDMFGIGMDDLKKFIMYENRRITKKVIDKYMESMNVLPLNIIHDYFVVLAEAVSKNKTSTLNSIMKMSVVINSNIQSILYDPYKKRFGEKTLFYIFNYGKASMTTQLKTREEEIKTRKNCIVTPKGVIVNKLDPDYQYKVDLKDEEMLKEFEKKYKTEGMKIMGPVKTFISKTSDETQRKRHIECNNINDYMRKYNSKQFACFHVFFRYNETMPKVFEETVIIDYTLTPTNTENFVVATSLMMEPDKTISIYTLEKNTNKKSGNTWNNYSFYVYNPNHKYSSMNFNFSKYNLKAFANEMKSKIPEMEGMIDLSVNPEKYTEFATQSHSIKYPQMKELDIFFIMWYAECSLKGITQEAMSKFYAFGDFFQYITLEYPNMILRNITTKTK